LYDDLINADGTVRLHEVKIRVTGSRLEIFLPGTAADNNRVPTTIGSNFIVRLGWRPRGTTLEMALHPKIVKRAGVDFDVDAWYAFLFPARRPAADSMSRFNRDYIRTLQGLLDTENGQKFLTQAIDLEKFANSVLGEAGVEDARRLFKEMPPEEFYSLKGWTEATRQTRDSKKLLGPSVAALTSLLEMSQEGALNIDLRVAIHLGVKGDASLPRLLDYMPGHDDFRQEYKAGMRESNALVAEVIHNMNNQIIDNVKDPLVFLMGLSKANTSLVTALLFAQKHKSDTEVRERLNMLLDYFKNTPEGQYFVARTEQDNLRTPFGAEVRYHPMTEEARHKGDFVAPGVLSTFDAMYADGPGKKTKTTRHWSPLVGQRIKFYAKDGRSQEAEITKVLQSLKNEMTVILIAHRLSTVQHADKIIYLDKGKIVAEGTFAELKSKVPDFAKAVQLMDLSDN
jgi:hypothetical protein